MGKYYDCAATFSNIQTNLLDYYGAYDAGTNPDGVVVYEGTSTELHFKCAPITGSKIIKFIMAADDLRAYYGDEYSGGETTNLLEFGGDNTTGSVTKIHLCCQDNSLLINTIKGGGIYSQVIVIGELTNGKFVVGGLVAHATAYTNSGFRITDDDSIVKAFGLHGSYQISGKLFKIPLVISSDVSGVELNGSAMAELPNIYSVSRSTGTTTAFKGTDYFVTTSGLYDANGSVLPNALMIDGLTA